MAYKLSYFNVRGLAEHIRMLMLDQGIAFEDHAFAREDWPTLKAKMQFGQVPCLYEGDKQIVQSNTIMRHLARKHGLYGANEDDATFADMVADAVQDIRNKYAHMVYQAFDNKATFVKEVLPGELAKIDSVVTGHGKGDFVLGDKMCYTDYLLFELLDVLNLSAPGCLDNTAWLKAFHDRMTKRPLIAAYLNTDARKTRKVNGNDNV